MVSGNSLSGVDVFGDAFSGIPAMGIFWKIGFEECKFSADWFSGREIFFVAIADLARGMVGQLISSCWRADKCAKDWMSKNKSKNKNKTNQTKKQHHPKTRKGHPAI